MSAVLIACGGTGGHLAPGIAIAEELQDRGHSAILLISRKQVDSALIRKYDHLQFYRAPGRAFSGGLTGRLLALLDVLSGLFFSIKLIRKHQPVSVLLFGGFLSLGLGLAARIHGVSVVVHEANCRPGRAVRILKTLASRIYLPEGVSLPVSSDRIRYYGYPVRREIKPCSKEIAREKLGIEISGKLLVIIGGSQGAEALNQWVQKEFKQLASAGVSVYCVAGIGKVIEEEILYPGPDGKKIRARFVAFTDQMAEVLSAADVVISRAGAGAIAEMIRCRTPAILIPYPHAADQHQLANAELHEKQGGGIVLVEDEMDSLLERTLRLIHDDSRLAEFEVVLEQLNETDVAGRMVDDILLAGGKQKMEVASS